MTTRRFSRVLCMMGLAMLASATQAELVNFVPPGLVTKVITFSSFDSGPVSVGSTEIDIGTAEVNEEVWLSSSIDSLITADSRSFAGNNVWPVSGPYASLNGAAGAMTVRFERGVNFVGGLLNHDISSDGSTIITPLDIDGDLFSEPPPDFFESELVDFIGGAQFRGILHSSANIYGFMLSSNFIAIDNLTFGTFGQVPEPGALVLVLAALAGLGWQQQRRTARSR